MKKLLEDMLARVYELEGLLLVMQRHQDEVPAVVLERFESQAALLTGQMRELTEAAREAKAQCAELPSPTPPAAPPAFNPPKPVQEASAQEPEPAAKAGRDVLAEFSINDRFFFQRELFDNDSERFTAAIARINDFTTTDEVSDFLAGELKLDAASPVVTDFLELIGRSFKVSSINCSSQIISDF